MAIDDYSTLDATALAALVRRREVTPLELVDAAIAGIERLNPEINAVITPMFDEARAAARGTLPAGPFQGVPFLLKDLGATYRGARMSFGSDLAGDYAPDYDSELVVRLKQAGLITLGKTNTPEFGIVGTTEPRRFGPTRNPWDTTRTAGGSSGGAAAAVAAGFVPMAHASDGGGSIRIPASYCGVFGLKPTRARNSSRPRADSLAGFSVEHAVTRSVRDSAALMDAKAGPAVGDPYWAPPPARPFLAEVTTLPGRLRIAVSTTAQAGITLHPDCVRATQEAARLCAELGHEIVEAAPAIDDALLAEALDTVWAVGVAASVNGLARLVGKTPSADLVEPLTWALYEQGCRTTAPEYVRALGLCAALSDTVSQFFTQYDLWLSPTLANPPLPLGYAAALPGDPLAGYRRDWENCLYMSLCNMTGQPGMSVPLYWTAEGLPVGAHFMGRFGHEATLFRLAAQLEQARPWNRRRPPLHV